MSLALAAGRANTRPNKHTNRRPQAQYIHVADQRVLINSCVLDAGAHLNLIKTHNKSEYEAASFFTNMFNQLRKLDGSTAVPIIVDSPHAPVTDKDLTKYQADFPIYHASTLPDFPPAVIDNPDLTSGYLVSKDIYLMLEDKTELAKVFHMLREPKQRIEIVKGYLQRKSGTASIEHVQKLSNLIARSIPKSGIVVPTEIKTTRQRLKNAMQNVQEALSGRTKRTRPLSKKAIDQRLRKLLEQNKEHGIVFQSTISAGGIGTWIITADEITDILENKKSCFDILSQSGKFNDLTKLIQEKKLTWQEFVEHDYQFSAMYDYNPETKSFDTTSVQTKYVIDNAHRGSHVFSEQDFPDFAKHSDDFKLLHEIVFDTILRNNGHHDGFLPILETGADCHTFGPDMFYQKATDDKEARIVISEYNVRIINTKRAFGAALKIDPDIVHQTPHSQISHPKVIFDKKTMSAFMELGSDKSGKLIHDLIKGELNRMPKAAIETMRFTLNEDDSAIIQTVVFFPYASDDKETKFSIVENISKILSTITPEMVRNYQDEPDKDDNTQESFMIHDSTKAVKEYHQHLSEQYQRQKNRRDIQHNPYI